MAVAQHADFGVPPAVRRRRAAHMLTARDAATQLGETTHASSKHACAPLCKLPQHPHVSGELRPRALGKSAVAACAKERATKEAQQHGRPLLGHGCKPVSLLSTTIRDAHPTTMHAITTDTCADVSLSDGRATCELAPVVPSFSFADATQPFDSGTQSTDTHIHTAPLPQHDGWTHRAVCVSRRRRASHSNG